MRQRVPFKLANLQMLMASPHDRGACGINSWNFWRAHHQFQHTFLSTRQGFKEAALQFMEPQRMEKDSRHNSELSLSLSRFWMILDSPYPSHEHKYLNIKIWLTVYGVEPCFLVSQVMRKHKPTAQICALKLIQIVSWLGTCELLRSTQLFVETQKIEKYLLRLHNSIPQSGRPCLAPHSPTAILNDYIDKQSTERDLNLNEMLSL